MRARLSDSVPMGKKARQGVRLADKEYLPMDIVYQILLHLPVKTLIKFRCVCKSWSSLITSPFFQQEHESGRFKERPFLLLAQKDNCTIHLSTYDSKETTPLNSFTITIPHRRYDPVIQSCRGLMCLAWLDCTILCNPSTQELMPLPPPPIHSGLTFAHCDGFGYAVSTHEFKVVRFFYHYAIVDHIARRVTHCEIFTLGTTQWKKATGPPPYNSMWRRSAPFLHGALHLLPSRYKTEYIAAFSLDMENYKQICLPEYSSHNYDMDRACLSELGGSLCLTLVSLTRFDLWLLKDYYTGEWTKQYSIDHPGLSNDVSRPMHPLVILKNGNILMNIIQPPNGIAELVCYDPKKKIATTKIGQNCSVAFYVESFFSLGTR